MNINDKITELGRGSGLNSMREKINQMVKYQNWLLSMRTAQGQISGGGRGPVIDTGPPGIAAAAGQAATGPWTQDPLGNPAKWLPTTEPNIPDLMLDTKYKWGSDYTISRTPGWMRGPSPDQVSLGPEAEWVGPLGLVSGQTPFDCYFWGIAEQSQAPIIGECSNLIDINYVGQNLTPTVNQQVFGGGALGINAVWPLLCNPVAFFQFFAQAVPGSGPFWRMTGYGGGGSDTTIEFEHKIEYEGFLIVASYGTALVRAVPSQVVFAINEPQMGYQYDPSIPGYIGIINPYPSNNPNPVITETLTISQPLFSDAYIPGGIEGQYFGIQFLTFFTN